MRCTVLSHAGLAVDHGSQQLLVDPWIIGSCYWRSWWNLPEPPPELLEGLEPSAIYLTHLHWDHFHGPSLRRFDRDTPVIVPRFNNDRMKRDLHYLGFDNVKELHHAERYELGDGLTIQSYQFLNDSALVITDGRGTVLDANDCKIYGLPLRQLLHHHPSIDLVLRSHSNASAYPYCIEGYDELFSDLRPPAAYLDDFAAFARTVGARHAVPFASNHCFLHPETEHYNALSVTPTDVQAHVAAIADTHPTAGDCVVMDPGSSWDPEAGFDLAGNDHADHTTLLADLADRHRATIDERVAHEASVDFDRAAFVAYFERFLAAVPRLARRRLGRIEFRVVEHGVEVPCTIDAVGRSITFASAVDPTFSIRCQAAVINDCTTIDMFSVWTPGKRLSARVRNREAVGALLLFFNLLDGLELDYFPLRRSLTPRMIDAAVRRWREPLQFLLSAVDTKVRRRPFRPWPA